MDPYDLKHDFIFQKWHRKGKPTKVRYRTLQDTEAILEISRILWDKLEKNTRMESGAFWWLKNWFMDHSWEIDHQRARKGTRIYRNSVNWS